MGHVLLLSVLLLGCGVIVIKGTYFGQIPILRQKGNVNAVERSYVDCEYNLPAGILKKFYVYVHPGISEPIFVRLQLWYPVLYHPPWQPIFQLLFEMRTVLHGFSGKHQFGVTSGPQLSSGCRLGFTIEGIRNPISYSPTAGYRTHHYDIINNSFPITNHAYVFNDIADQASYSIGVDIYAGGMSLPERTGIIGPTRHSNKTGPRQEVDFVGAADTAQVKEDQQGLTEVEDASVVSMTTIVIWLSMLTTVLTLIFIVAVSLTFGRCCHDDTLDIYQGSNFTY